MRILITGGFGYVGGRVARHLAEHAAHQVFLSTRRVGVERPSWLNSGDIVPASALESRKTWSEFGIEAVVHLGTAHELICNKDPQTALQVNGFGTHRLLRNAIEAEVKRFVHFSTVHVYRTPLQGRLDETIVPRPVPAYAIAHRTGEDFVLSSRDRGEIDAYVLRLSNAFGAPAFPDVDRWTLLANELCREAVERRTITLKTSGLQWRNFVTLTDVGRAVAHFIDLPVAAGEDGLFNLVGPESWRVLDLSEAIAARCENTLGYRPELIRPLSATTEVVSTLELSSAKLLRTGFTFTSQFADEIDELLHFCKKHFGAARASSASGGAPG